MAYSQTKEERDNKTPKQYIANGKVVYVNNGITVAEKEETPQQTKEEDTLPF